MASSESVTLISSVETLAQRYRPGHQFHVRSWWETPDGSVADLIDAAGVLRISHCPIDRFVSVSQELASVAETAVSGSLSEEPIVDRATPESAALPGTEIRSVNDERGTVRTAADPVESHSAGACPAGNDCDYGEGSTVAESGDSPDSRCTPGESDREVLDRNPSLDDGCPFDANVELQLSREPRHVEHRPVPSFGRRPFAWLDLPQRPPGYVAPLILGKESAPPWAFRSADHPLRSEWGPKWNLSEYCTQCPAYGRPELVYRMICHATRLDTTNGSVLRFMVDLNNSQFWPWGGPWQSNAATVSKDAASDSEIGSEPQPVDPMPETATPAVTSYAKTTVAPWLCEFGEYPEPSASWTVDQLRGWRTVRDRDGTICGKFGPDAPEHKHQWAAWLVRVQEFAKGLQS